MAKCINGNVFDYNPDFVAETNDFIYMIETKASNELASPVVSAKKDAAKNDVNWQANTTKQSLKSRGSICLSPTMKYRETAGYQVLSKTGF